MRFDFTEDQYALRDGAREFLAGECTAAHLRQTWDSEEGIDRGRWEQLAKTGLLGVTVPERHGGLGLDEVDLVLLLEEAGYAGLPEPLCETTAVAIPRWQRPAATPSATSGCPASPPATPSRRSPSAATRSCLPHTSRTC